MTDLINRHSWAARWIQSTRLLVKAQIVSPEAIAENAMIFKPEKYSGRGAVIYLHGLGNDLFFPNLGFIETLVGNGFPVLAMDLAGHGQNGSTLFTLDHLMAQIPAARQALLTEFPDIGRIHLAGFSFGAALSAHYVATHPDEFQSLTMIAMPRSLSLRIGYLSEFLSPVYRDWRAAVNKYTLSGIQPALSKFRRNIYPLRCPDNTPYLTLANSYLTRMNLPENLRGLKTPSLGIFGQYDFISPASAVADLLSESVTRTRTLPAANHFLTLLSPQTWNLTVEFLRTLD
jgi:pimeloyl-ACP methyl ester carboxylesterase